MEEIIQVELHAWQKGGGHKRKYRIIDFKRNKDDIDANVERIEYDPNRSSFIALINIKMENLSYILAPQKLQNWRYSCIIN